MGIDEALAIPGVIYVDQDATGDNDGSSWEDAYTELQPALENAAGSAEIWVAEGTYTPTYESSLGDPRSATFQLRNGVALYGGFDPSVGDTGWEDRDWVKNVTILSGDIGIQATPPTTATRLLPSGGAGPRRHRRPRRLYGLRRHANDADQYDGGGMYNYESSPAVANCTFSDNSQTAAADVQPILLAGGDQLHLLRQLGHLGRRDAERLFLAGGDQLHFSGNSASDSGGGCPTPAPRRR